MIIITSPPERFSGSIAVPGTAAGAPRGEDNRSRIKARQAKTPGDISLAAYFMVAAAAIPGSEVFIRNVAIKPGQGYLDGALTAMGAGLQVRHRRYWGGNPVADIGIRGGEKLKAVRFEMARSITTGELAALLVAAAAAEGKTEIVGLHQLEAGRRSLITALAGQLHQMNVTLTEADSSLVILRQKPFSGAAVDCCGDSHVAMALAVAGLAAAGETVVHGAEAIRTCFPDFMAVLRSLTVKKAARSARK